jgi:hypothetical protein
VGEGGVEAQEGVGVGVEALGGLKLEEVRDAHPLLAFPPLLKE